MTSERQIAANRRNSRRSCGPRSAGGKFFASRNALRHGLAAITHRPPSPTREVALFAEALCGEARDPELVKYALEIAQEEQVLRAIREQQRAAVERLRDTKARALAKGDNSLKLAKARMREFEEAHAELMERRKMLIEKHKDQLQPPLNDEELGWLFAGRLGTILLDEAERLGGTYPTHWIVITDDDLRDLPGERGDTDAIEAAAPDLLRLDRYERRARARQNRAIRAFINTQLSKAIGGGTATSERSDAAGAA